MKITKTKTPRGFFLYEFKDIYDRDCSFQESSNAEKECIWLGSDTPDNGRGRMHIDRKGARKLAKLLSKFADEGWSMFDNDRRGNG